MISFALLTPEENKTYQTTNQIVKKFIDNIVELTNKISGLELKFGTFENKSFRHEETRSHDMRKHVPTT